MNQFTDSQVELDSMGEGCVLGLMVYNEQWLKMKHQTMFCQMLNRLLKNPIMKYQKLQLT